MKSNQKGFSLVEGLVVLVMVGLIGAVGWLVYDRQKDKENNQPAITKDSDKKDQTAEDETPVETLPAGYRGYENEELGVVFNYPEKWGEVNVDLRARNREDFEPVKTYFMSFSESSKFYIKISPITWKFTGGDSDWDFPETDESFQEAGNKENALQILSDDTVYLQMEWTEINAAVTLRGAKRLDLTKVPAKYVEFEWAPVSDNCTTEFSNGAKIPQISCYEQDLVRDTQKIVESFKAN